MLSRRDFSKWNFLLGEGAIGVQGRIVAILLGMFVLLGGLLYFLNYRVSVILSRSDDLSYLINLSGRQRMLSQSLVNHYLLSEQGVNPEVEQFDSVSTLFDVSHDLLLQSNMMLETDQKGLDQLNALFDEIEIDRKELKDAILLDTIAVAGLLQLEEHFIEQMDAITFQYQRINETNLNRVSTAVQYSTVIFVITLLLVGILFYFAVNRLILAYVQNLERLKDVKMKLIQTEKMASIGRLSGGLAHEINNAMNFVQNGVLILKENLSNALPDLQTLKKVDKESLRTQYPNLKSEKDPAEKFEQTIGRVNQMIEYIQEGSHRTTQIIKGLGIYAKSGRGIKSEIDLNAEVASCVRTLLTDIPESPLDVQLLPEPLLLLGDAEELKQAFLNIIKNGIEATLSKEADGKVTVGTSSEDNWIVLTITDNGIGMSKSVLKKMYDPFFSTKSLHEGSGLGLAISLGVIENHGGTISIDSWPKKGTRVIVKLPKLKERGT